MTYSLHTLNNETDPTPALRGFRRFTQEIALTLGFVFLLFWLIALISHNAQDPAWTTSGASAHLFNWGGKLGAWLSDLSYFLFGYSVVWAYGAAFMSWLTALLGKLHGELTGNGLATQEPKAQDQNAESGHVWIGSNWAFWSGLGSSWCRVVPWNGLACTDSMTCCQATTLEVYWVT
jgi:S-DNA-T family DNA segregation ATPase FtsK/SpoIIIE